MLKRLVRRLKREARLFFPTKRRASDDDPTQAFDLTTQGGLLWSLKNPAYGEKHDGLADGVQRDIDLGLAIEVNRSRL